MSGSAERRKVRLINREIIFQEFQPVWSQSTNVTDGRTDRRRDRQTTYHGNTALRYASRGKNENNKKAVLSQRWPRNAPYTWVPWIFSGLPDYAHGYYSQHFSWAFVPIDHMNVPTKFEVSSFTRSWGNRGYPKIGQSLDAPTPHFLQNFNGLLFGLDV